MARLIHELRYAIRVLNKNRGYALIGLLTLTLGIAANITVFSATNAFLMRLMEVPEARLLIRLYDAEDRVDRSQHNPAPRRIDLTPLKK